MNFKKNLIILFVIALTTTNTYNSIFTAAPKKTITLFSHGIADSHKQAYAYAKSYKKNGILHFNDRYLIHTPYVSFNYPDATDKFYRVNWTETSFGQENEIGRLNLAYKHIMDRYEDCNVILWGLSRGASNQSIFAGLYNHYDNIKAILLESPYNSMTEVIESMMHKKNLGWMPVSYGESLAEFIFKKYTRYGWSPKKVLDKISKDIPVLIICSEEDNTVPCSSSINVYKNLVAAGHKHTYILILEHGRHAQILQGPDGEIYQDVVNAFYKKYNLPHSPESAAKGEPLLALCQPIV
jgi:hypothetical protein